MIEISIFNATWVMPQSFVQIRPNWNEMEYSAKRTKIGSDFISFTFINSDSSYQWYMSNATKFRSDSSKIGMKWNIGPRSTKRAEKGSDFISFTFNNSDISYPCYMSNATKLRSDSSKLESNGIQCKEALGGLKKAQILFLSPLMIKIYNFDVTWVMPQSFVQIRPNWNIAPRGSDFIYFTFNNSDISYQCNMSNATKFVQIHSNWWNWWIAQLLVAVEKLFLSRPFWYFFCFISMKTSSPFIWAALWMFFKNLGKDFILTNMHTQL